MKPLSLSDLSDVINGLSDAINQSNQSHIDQHLAVLDACDDGNDFPPRFPKYTVIKRDGTTDPDANYFVIRLDEDPHAIAAALAYAKSCYYENTDLAVQLIQAVAEYADDTTTSILQTRIDILQSMVAEMMVEHLVWEKHSLTQIVTERDAARLERESLRAQVAELKQLLAYSEKTIERLKSAKLSRDRALLYPKETEL